MRRAKEMRAGDVVVLRPPAEILATLDESGCLDGVPFMPEMLQYFDRRYTVTAQVSRACDTISYTGVRRFRNTVMLEDLRCDGTAHAGCGAQCRLLWKEAWLRPAGDGSRPATGTDGLTRLEALVTKGRHAPDTTPERPTFRCQATELLRGSEPVGWYSVRSFLHELTSRNVSPGRYVRVMARMVYEEIAGRVGRLSTHAFRPDELAAEPKQQPAAPTDAVRIGDLVQIRSREEIRQTLDVRGKTRGLWFDREMVPYCGQTARVKAKVERFIDETDGHLVELRSDCYILDGVVCSGERSDKRWFCPRKIYPWWRETWLEPVEGPASEFPAIE